MAAEGDKSRFVFPKWTNWVVPIVLIAVAAGLPYKMLLVRYGLAAKTLNENYQPRQPIAYSHELHAGQLGIDCRYCHTTVEDAAFAAIPPTQTCMNCHFAVKKTDRPGSEQDIAKIIASYESRQPIKWKKVHDLPDYAFFNHSVHINVGVSCVECHGRVDKMDGDRTRVSTHSPLSMGWCIECHRKPEKVLRPADQVFNLNWGNNLTDDEVSQIKALAVEGVEIEAGDSLDEKQRMKIGHAMALDKDLRSVLHRTDCSLCHR